MGEWPGDRTPCRDVSHHRHRWGAPAHPLPTQATLAMMRVRGMSAVQRCGEWMECGQRGVLQRGRRTRGVVVLPQSAGRRRSQRMPRRPWRAEGGRLSCLAPSPCWPVRKSKKAESHRGAKLVALAIAQRPIGPVRGASAPWCLTARVRRFSPLSVGSICV